MSHIVNGHRCLTSTVHSDFGGLVGEFTVTTPFHYGVGELVQVNNDDGVTIADGFIRSTTCTPNETTVYWAALSPPRLGSALDIIDPYARALASRRPA